MPDEFSKKTVKKFGARGSPVFEQEEKTTDLADLDERVEQTAVPFCECGARLAGEVYRCCQCEIISCGRCHVERSRYNYCPTCARRQFGLDKRTFLSLVFLDHGVMAPDDLLTITTHDGEVLDLVIDPAADTLVEHDYLTDEGTLSAAGKEALAVGHQLYGDDRDIRAVRDQLRLQEVATRD